MLVLVGLACFGCSGAGSKTEPLNPPPQRPAVEMTLPQLGGGTHSIQQHRGHPVVITLFTTWCLRCQAEAPLFVRLHETQRRLRVVGVALDDLTKLSLVQTYVQFVGFQFPVLLAEPNNLDLVGGLGATPQVPRTVLLDPAGRVAQDHVGQTDFPRLERGIKRVLGREKR
ncbi:MAG: TlpA family protein disulfide reductase [Deltaproteobacteria bacterium]|jgi:thiol-disulfide isomerase/thioredoxin|nr:TlpA family protein disulfide reductase [Deltaproteobacteria bacterium]